MTSNRTKKKPYRLNEMVDILRDDITIRGLYAPGEFLPSELALVKRFGMSNKTVRKGLQTLTEEGLIEKIPRVGSIVSKTAKRPATRLLLGSMHSLERDMKMSLLLERFGQLHPDIRVEVVLFSSDDYAGAVDTYLRAGLVDALMINDQLFWEIEGALGEPHLEPMPDSDDAYSFLRDSFASGGTQFARPILFSPVVLAYNKDHFREAGVPEPDGSWTWDDAIAQASKLSVPGERYGLCFYPLSDNRWPVFPLQSGVRLEADSGEGGGPAARKLLDSFRLYKSIVRNRDVFPDYMAESSRDFAKLFRDGRASMILSTYMSLNDFASVGPDFDISAVPYRGEPRTLLTTIGIAVNRYSNKKAAAMRLVDFMSSEIAQRLIRERTLSIPAMKRVADAPVENDALPRRPSRFHLYRNIVPGYRRHRDMGLAPESFYRFRELLKRYAADLIDEERLIERIGGNAAAGRLL
ncbi:extracellular solute-binding protein [Paenibacillus sp. GYB003]|uniref:extracellular solute-binding protein n=1 Tax=Paenibacillus sp. GYB003 TaxID=2994392 RepID=UPI002F96760C